MRREEFVPGEKYISKKSLAFCIDRDNSTLLHPGQICTFLGWRRFLDADLATDYSSVRSCSGLYLVFDIDGVEVYTIYNGVSLVPAPLETLHPGASPRELETIKLEKHLTSLTQELKSLETQLEGLLNHHEELQRKIATTNLQIRARKGYESDADFMTATIKALGIQATPEKITEIATALSISL